METQSCIPSSTKPEWLQADRQQKKVVSSSYTPSSQIYPKCLKSFLPCPCMAHLPGMAYQLTTLQDGILLNTMWEHGHPPCSHILHTCPPNYSPQRHMNPIHFQQFAHGHTCPLQGQQYWHIQLTPSQK